MTAVRTMTRMYSCSYKATVVGRQQNAVWTSSV